MKHSLVLHNATKTYGHEKGVQNISLQIKRGEVFGFLGPNGAGKTTTIRMIMNFIQPTRGSITILGHNSVTDSVEIKSKIGYLAGDIALYSHMTGNQLLHYLASLGKPTQWTYVGELTHMLDAELHRPINQLSKGNKQKIGIIQALMHQPDLILLDEPTNSLDPLMQQIFYDIIEKVKQQGKTVFISSHNLQEVQRLCERVAFIRQGELIGTENIGKTPKLTFRRYKVHFKNVPKESDFQNITEVSDITIHNNEARVTITGSPNNFLKMITSYEILDFSEEEATLEEIFMHYYKS